MVGRVNPSAHMTHAKHTLTLLVVLVGQFSCCCDGASDGLSVVLSFILSISVQIWENTKNKNKKSSLVWGATHNRGLNRSMDINAGKASWGGDSSRTLPSTPLDLWAELGLAGWLLHVVNTQSTPSHDQALIDNTCIYPVLSFSVFVQKHQMLS